MDLTNVSMTAIICLAIASVILGVAFFINGSSKASTEADRQVGIACAEAGGSWVNSVSGYQCIAGEK